MKIYAILVFTSLWLIHVRFAHAINAPGAPGYGSNFRQNGQPASAYRRAHYHHPYHSHGKPGIGGQGQFKKKWYPPPAHQGMPQLSQRPRRPAPPPPQPPQPQPSHIGSAFMRQRLGLGVGPPPPPPQTAQSEFKLQHEMQNVQQLQQQQQQLLSKNFISKPTPHKWNNFPSRNLKTQHQQKPFLSSPKIQSEVEYHIQSNQIPNQPIMIKQLDDEKGPIHTIPAPNLSLADKPKQVHIYQPKQQSPPQQHLLQPQFESTTLRVLKPASTHHQYQVTESPDSADKLLQQDAEIPPIKPESHSTLPITEDVFGLLPVQDGYAYSVLHQPQLQQHILQQQQSNAYQTMLVQPQFFQPDPTFLESHQRQHQHLQKHKQMATPPEMHTFNYVEPKHVSAEYILQAEPDDDDRDGKQDGGVDYYSSLPSKDAADSFAALQDAGRRQNAQNDQTGAGSSKQQEMMIYVPDEQEQFDPAEDLEQYEANDDHGEKSKRFGFGRRIRPKT